MKKLLCLGLFVLFALPLNGFAQGRHGMRHGEQHEKRMQGHSDGPKWGKIGFLLRMSEKLELTEEQQNRLTQIRIDFKIASVDQKAEVQKSQIRLQSILRDKDASERDVMNAIDGAAEQKATVAKMRYRHRGEVMAILSDSQREKLEDIRKEGLKSKSSNDHSRKWRKRNRFRGGHGG